MAVAVYDSVGFILWMTWGVLGLSGEKIGFLESIIEGFLSFGLLSPG